MLIILILIQKDIRMLLGTITPASIMFIVLGSSLVSAAISYPLAVILIKSSKKLKLTK